MSHPFDDKDLTFADLKEIVRRALAGEIDIEEKASEKTDGQNLMISWKNGKLIAARNKGNIKNFGANAMDKASVAAKFDGRGELTQAFVGAMDDMERAIGSLSSAQQEKIFGEGKRFMNLEVIWTKNANVIQYNKNLLIFHGILEYDEAGNAIGEERGFARILAGMIKQVNQNVQNNYEIVAPPSPTLPKSGSFEKDRKAFFSEIDRLKNQYKLKDTDAVMKYHIAWWTEFITKAANQHKYALPDNVLSGLLARWAYNNKGGYSLATAKNEIDNEAFLNWMTKTDKEDLNQIFKKNIRPFEILFLKLGSQVLLNIRDVVAANPDKAIQGIKNELNKVISDIKSSKDLTVLSKLEAELQRLDSIGGMDAIVPLEGLVFTYKGKIYKLTGTFAPINQILGLMRYVR